MALALGAPAAPAQTGTVTLSVPAGTEFAEGNGATTVTVTATIASARSTNLRINLSLAGTAQASDYSSATVQNITITAGQTAGTADVTLTPVDDFFFEGTETVRVAGAAGSGWTVAGVDVPLTDNDTAPSLTVTITSDDASHEEGHSGSANIRANLVGGELFEASEDINLEVFGIAAADATFGTDPPWTVTIPAGQTASNEITVTYTVVDDDDAEDQETASVQASVTVAGTRLTASGRLFTIAGSDQTAGPYNFHVFCAEEFINSDYKPKYPTSYVDVLCDARVGGGRTVSRDYTVTLSPHMDSPELTLTPARQTFTIRRGESQSPGRDVDFTVSDGAGGRQITADVTVSPNDQGETATELKMGRYWSDPKDGASIGWIYLSSLGSGSVVTTGDLLLRLQIRTDWPVRPLVGPASVEMEIDSGVVTGPCHVEEGHDGDRISCTIKVAAGDYDFDGIWQLRAGAVKIPGGWKAFDDDKITGSFTTLPARDEVYRNRPLVYGGSEAIDLRVSPESLQEGTGEQALTIHAQVRSLTPAPMDLVLPLSFVDITTSSSDYVVSGPLSVTIPKDKTEGSTTAVLFTPVDDRIKEDRIETVRIQGTRGALLSSFVRGADINVIDTARIKLSVSPTEVNEGSGAQTLNVTAAWAEATDAAAAHDVEVRLSWGGSAGSKDYDRTVNQLGEVVTIPANARSGTSQTAILVKDDYLLEGDETIVISGRAAGRSVQSTEVTLKDDEKTPAVSLAVDVDTLLENGGAKTVMVSAKLDPTVAMANDVTNVTLDLAGTATEGTDYSASWSPSSKVISIPHGETAGSNTVTLTLTPTDDRTSEGDETIVVQGVATTDMASRNLVVKVATIALEDDDVHGIFLSTPALTVDEGATDTYEVWLGTQPTGNVTVSLSSTDATIAKPDQDVLTFTTDDWEMKQTVTVSGVEDDRKNIGDKRTAMIRHTAGGGGYDDVDVAELGVTVNDNDEAVRLTIADATAAEGEAVTFTVTRLGAPGNVVTVDWSTADDATDGAHPASSADDYTPQTAAQTLSFAAGETSKTFTVQTTQDTLDEEDETFLVQLSSASTGTSISDGEATGTITDDDATTAELSFDAVAAVAEGAADTTATMTFTVTLSAASGRQVTVDYADAGTGTATAGEDYSLTAGTLTFAPGDTSKTIEVTVNGDGVDEDNETVTVRLSSPVNAGFAAGATTLDASGAITDDDTRGITVSAATDGVTVAEADDSETATTTENVAVYTVALDSQPSGTVTIGIESGDTDVATVSPASLEFTTASWGAKTVTVTGQPDNVDNADDRRTTSITHTVAADDTDYAAEMAADVTVTVTDDDTPAWTVAVDSSSIAEDGGTATVTVSSGGVAFAADQTVTLALTGTATRTADYTIGSQSLTLAAGDTSVTTTVTGVDDTLDDDAETVVIAASVGGSAVGTAQTITITDDDVLAWAVAVDPAAIDENAGTSTVTVSTGGVTFAANRTIALGLTGTATKTTDYTIGAESLTLTAGVSSVTTTVTGVDDTLDDDAETVVIAASVGGSTVGTAQTITITDDDVLAWAVAVDPAAIDENAGTSTVTVSTGGVTFAANQTIALGLTGTATKTTDYTIGAESLTLTAGTTSAATTVTGVDDSLDDDAETVVIAASVGGSAVGTAQTITITDDDVRGITVSAAASGVTVAEADNPGTSGTTENVAAYTVALDSQPTGTVTIDLESRDTDVVTVSPASLTFTTTSWGAKTVTVTGVSDDVDNANNRRTTDITHTVAAANTDYAGETAANVAVTVTDDEATPVVTLALDPVTLDEDGGTDGDNNVSTVTAALDHASHAAVTVTVSVPAGAPVTQSGTTLTIAAGAKMSTGTVTLTAVDNDVDAPDAEVAVSGAATGGGVSKPADVTLTITDDEATPTFSVADGSGDEGDAISFVVTREGATGNAVTVDWATAVVAGQATAADFTAVAATTLSFAAGVTEQTVTVQTTQDTLDEPNETFEVKLTNPGKVADDPGSTPTLTRDTATGTITDDDAVPSFSVADGSGDEGDAISFVVTREGATGNAVTVDWGTAVVAGQATAADFTAVAAITLSFAAGVTEQTVTVQTTQDTLDEPNETFEVKLTNPGKVADDPGSTPTLTDDTATGTITDDDAVPTFSVADGSGDEGDAISFVVTREGATGNAVTVDWATAVVAGQATMADFTAVAATTLSFAAGVTEQTVTVQTTQDTLDEPNETFEVKLTNPGKVADDPGSTPTLTDDTATGTITDDDAVPTFSVADGSGDEGDAISFVVTREGATGNAVTVDWATAAVAGQATAADFTAVAATTLSFAAGVTEQTVTVQTTQDTLDEPNETFEVKLTNPGKVADDPGSTPTLTRDTATGTITDDDAVPSFSVADGSGDEGDAISFVVTREGATGNAVTVDWATAAVAGQATAADFTAVAATTLSFAAGVTEQTVTVQTTQDTLDEPNETFEVKLTNPGKVADDPGSTPTLTDDTATGTITDDDAVPTFSVADGSGDEGDAISFVVTREGATGNAVTVDWATAVVAGQATAADFTAVAATTLSFAAGVTEQTVTVQTTQDTLDEPNETFEVKLTNPGKVADDPGSTPTLTRDTATGTITDDDAVPTFSVADGSGSEGDGISFVVTRAGATANAVTVDWATALVASQATAADFTAVTATTLSFAAGDTSKTVTVQTTEDALDEPNETFEVQLTDPAKAAGDPGATPTLTRDTATGTITDDDAVPTFSVADGSGSEGDGISFVVTRAGATANAVTVDWATALVASQATAADFTAVTATTLSFAAGDTSKTVTVQTTEDALDEPNETFEVKLTSPANAAGDPGATPTLTDATATGTITDDDATPTGITLTLSPTTVGEEDGETEITVTAAVNGSSRYVDARTVTVSVGGGSAVSGTDYAEVEDFEITIAAGAASHTGTFDLTPTNDVLDEANETIDVTGAAGTLTVTKATLTLEDNDAAPSAITLTVDADTGANDVQTSIAEGGGAKTVRVTATITSLSRFVAAQTVSVEVGKTGDSATKGTDYTAVTTRTITIDAGAASGHVDFTLTPVNDDIYETNEEINIEGTLTGVTFTQAAITITDDEATPTLTLALDPATIAESGASNRSTVTARLSGESSAAVTVAVAAAPGADTATTDFTLSASPTLTIAAGATASTGTVTITAVDNDVDAPDKSVTVSGTASGGNGVGNPVDVTLAITDDEVTPTLTLALDPATIAEAGDGNVSTVTARLSGESSAAVSVAVSVPAGAPVTLSTNATLTIAAGATASTGVVTLTAVDNDVDAPNAMVAVSGAASGGNGVSNPADATLTITDDEGAPTLSLVLTPATIAESGASNRSTVTARLSGESSAAVTVAVAAAPGADTATTDFTLSASPTLTIAAGATASTGTVTITAVDNDVDAPDKSVTVSGTASGGNGVGNPVDVTLAITDDEVTPTLTLALDPATIAEAGDGNVSTVTARLSGESSAAVTVAVSVPAGAPVTLSTNATLTIAAGATASTGTVTLTAVDNEVDAPDKSVTVSGTASGGNEVDDPADVTLTITDDEATPVVTLALDPATIEEDGGADGSNNVSTVTAALDHASHAAVTVAVSAPAGSPVTLSTNTTLTIAAGATASTGVVTLTATNNNVDAPDAEVVVSGAAGGGDVANPAGVTLTITDDDATPTMLALTVDTNAAGDGTPTTVAEGGGAATVRVTAMLTGTSTFAEAKTVTVEVGATDDSATEGTDYANVATQSIEIAAGASSGFKDFTLTPTDDSLHEGSETISLDGTLSGVTVTDATITLTDDDGPPTALTLTVDTNAGGNGTPTTVAEGGGAATVRVTATLGGTSTFTEAKTVTVEVGATDDSATEGTDYANVATQSIEIAAGSSSGYKDFTLTPTQDTLAEGSESITVAGALTDVTVTDAEITLTDDDGPPTALTLSVDADTGTGNAQDSLAEDGGAKTVRVTAMLTGTSTFATAKTVTVEVGATDDSATEGTDYANVATQSIEIAAGSSSGYKDFTLTPTQDTLAEGSESITVAGALTDVTVTDATITLTDDDTAPTALTLTVDTNAAGDGTPTTVAEDGGAATVRVTATLGGTSTFTEAKTVTVEVGATDDSATEGTDYANVGTQSIEIAAGSSSGYKDFTLTPTQDTLAEGSESITVAGALTDVTVTDAEITLTDDDGPPTALTLTVDTNAGGNGTPTTVAEGGGAATVRVTATLGGTSTFTEAKTVTVEVGATDDSATEGTDYANVGTQSIEIAAGSSSGYKDFTLTPTQDTLAEGSESITVAGALTDVTVTDAEITLTDDDGPPTALTLSVDADTGTGNAQDSLAEDGGAKTVRVTATLGGTTTFTTAKTVTVEVGATDDSATEGTDYANVGTQSIEIAAGSLSGYKDFTLTPTQDTLVEGDESISVAGTLTDLTVTPTAITLTDDDAAPTALTLTVDADTGTGNAQDSLAEDGGAKTVRVTATLGGSSTFTVARTVTVEVGKTTDSATEGTDYANVGTQSIEIAAGASSGFKDFTLTPTQDTLVEGDETISLDGTLTGVTVTDAEITLTDDDAAPTALTLTVDADTGTNNVQGSLAEDGGTKTVRVTATLDGTSTFTTAQTVTVEVGATDDSATEGTDYANVGTQSITINAGSLSGYKDFTLTPTQDTLVEGDESISVAGTLTDLTVTPAAITLTDDDAAPTALTLSVDTNAGGNGTPTTVAEGGGAATVRVTAMLTGTSTFTAARTVTVEVGKSSDSATEGTDYANVGTQSIEIAAGASSGFKDFTLTPTQDTLVEGSETISLEGTLTDVTVAPAAITLTDDDGTPTALTLTVDADTGTNNVQGSLAEDGGAKTVRVTATLAGTSTFTAARTVTVEVGKSSDSATEGTDYANVATQSITINAGSLSGYKDFTLTPTQDMLVEGDESISVEGTLTDLTVTPAAITLTDDDGVSWTVGVNPAAIAEDGGTSTVTVSTGGATFATDQTVTLGLMGTATKDTDYTIGSESLTLTAGQTSVTTMVTGVDDTVDDDAETVVISARVGGGTVGTTQTVTITDDDDGMPYVEINSVEVDEGEMARFMLSLSQVQSVDTSVTAATVDDTAQAPGDYDETEKTVTIPAGSMSVVFEVQTHEDTLDEDDEHFKVMLSNPVNAIVNGDEGSGVIRDKLVTVVDLPDISINSVAVVEGKTARFTLTLSAALEVAASVLATTEDGTARQPRDYRHRSQRVTIPAGDTRAVFEVRTVNDRAQEDEEYFRVRLSAPDNAVIRKGVGRGAIEDDDLPTLRLGDASAREGEPLTFELSIEPASTTALTLRYFTQDRTARAGLDYVAVEEETVTIEAGVTTRQITVPTLDDRVDEPDEAFRLLVTLPRTVTVIGTGTIIDDDAAPTLTVADAAANEGDTLAFPVSLSAAAGYPVSVEWALTPGTATPGEDYVAASGTLTIPAGAQGGVIEVATLQDLVDEPDETLTVTLSGPQQAVLGEAVTAVGAIRDDDETPVLTVAGAEGTEGDVLVFPVRLSEPSGLPVRVDWSLRPGTAAAGEDYVMESGVLELPAGETAAAIVVQSLEDSLDEPAETFTLRVAPAGDASVSDIEVSGRIIDDDEPPLLTVADAEAWEGEDLAFAVSLSAPSGHIISVDWSLHSGTALAGSDYMAGSGAFTLPAGETAGVIAVESIEDAVHEADETFSLQLAAPRHVTLTRERATATVLNDDVLPVLSIADAEAEEGAALVFPVRLSEPSGLPVRVDWSLRPGTAAAGEDYVMESGVLELPAGETAAAIVVQSLEDSLDEPAETLTLVLSSPRLARLAQASAQGVLLDDDDVPQLSSNSPAATEGETLVFALRLSSPSARPVSVAWRTEDETAVAGEDYTAAAGVAALAPGETGARIEVVTLDDMRVEPDETLRLVFSDPRHALPPAPVTGRVADDDRAHAARLRAVNESILPQVAAALVQTRLDRLQDCLDEEVAGATGGAALGALLRRLPESSSALQDDNRSVWERLGGSRYKQTFKADEGDEGDTAPARAGLSPAVGDLTVCAGVDWRRLAAERLGTDWDGSLYGGHLGGHVRLGTYTLAGVNVSQSYVDVDYETAGDTARGEWALSLTGVQPYVSRSGAAGQRVWVMAGWGTGELTLDEGGRKQDADVNQWQGALGGALPLQWGAAQVGGWQRSLSLRGDAWWGRLEIEDNETLVTQVDTHSNGLRAGLDSRFTRALNSGALSLTTGAGVRYDNGAGGAGVEWAGGVDYTGLDRRLHATLNARALLLRGHTREWGLSALAKLDPEADGSGLSFTLAPGWGQSGSSREALWAGALTGAAGTASRGLGTGFQPVSGRAAWGRQGAVPGMTMTGRDRAGPTFRAELGYGVLLPHQRGVLTPLSAYDRGGRSRQWRLGLRWLWRPGLTLELDGRYREDRDAAPEAGMFLKLGIAN